MLIINAKTAANIAMLEPTAHPFKNHNISPSSKAFLREIYCKCIPAQAKKKVANVEGSETMPFQLKYAPRRANVQAISVAVHLTLYDLLIIITETAIRALIINDKIEGVYAFSI